MAKTLDDAADQLHTTVTAITGLNDPGTTAPESINTFPFVVTMPDSGSWMTEAANQKKGLHTLRCEIHVPLRNFPTNKNEVQGYGETVYDAIVTDPTLNGTVDTVIGVRYTFGPLGYGTLETYGYAFEVDVKIRSSFS